MGDKFGEVYGKMDMELMGKVPKNIAKLCQLLAKSMKQTPNTILLMILSMFSVAVGHGNLKVNSRWTESVQLWIIINMKTGRGKSTLHRLMHETFGKVIYKMEHGVCFNVKRNGKDIIMPHCTWEKFGEVLALNGGRIMGLYDELMSFFTTANLHTSGKTKASNENQAEFLSMFNCGPKRRETLGGNANYNINTTSLTIMGFTQPEAATSLINDVTSTNIGFTNRFLWYFPRPLYAYFEELEISKEEEKELNEISDVLVEALTDTYKIGDKECLYAYEGKLSIVEATPMQFTLSNGAKEFFRVIHNEFEDITKSHTNDNFITGLYSRSKSQILRMSCVIEIMNSTMASHVPDEVNDVLQEVLRLTSGEDQQTPPQNTTISVSKNSMELAYDLVNISLNQLRLLRGLPTIEKQKMDGAEKFFGGKATILRTNGKVISAPILVKGNKVRQFKGNMTQLTFISKIFEELEKEKFGKTVRRQANNNAPTLYFCKAVPTKELKTPLETVGIDFQGYMVAYSAINQESETHKSCYTASKKRRLPQE